MNWSLEFPWLLFFTEFATARIQEPFVLYRSYLWMPGLVAAFPFLTQRLAIRHVAILCVALALVFGVAMRDRLASFESNLALWDDVVRKNSDLSLIFVDRGYSNRAVALLRDNRNEEALRDLDISLRLNPLSPHAFVNRGTIVARFGQLDKAMADFDRALALDASFAEAHAEKCATYIKMNLAARALESCEAALRLAPQLSTARLNRAVLNAQANHLREALEDIEAVLKVEPDHAIALYNRGMIFRQTARPDEAAQSLRASCVAGFPPACDAMR